MARLGQELAQVIVERLPRNTNYITFQGGELHLDCFNLTIERKVKDFAFIQAACVLGAARRVIFSTWRITLEWGFDDAYPEIRVFRLDLEEFRRFLHLINRLPFEFESRGREVIHAWLYEDERISIRYVGPVVFESEDPEAPTLLDHFTLSLAW